MGGAQALANTVGGGYGTFSESGGVTTTLDSVQVESPAPADRVCAAFRAATRVMAIRASCLDDKDVPHPASQVSPERRVADAYEGEVYRCIAGTRLQYTVLQSETAADGRSVSCRKGDALYRQRDGRLQCRPQKPARDCNERSLLRRYGAGMKLVAVFEQQECVSWRQAGEASQAPQSTGPVEVSVSEP